MERKEKGIARPFVRAEQQPHHVPRHVYTRRSSNNGCDPRLQISVLSFTSILPPAEIALLCICASAMAESPGSPLSSLASDDLTEDMKLDQQGQSPSASTANMPPSKRRRTGISSWDRHTPMSSAHEDMPPTSPSTSISSDTSGDIPNSPNTAALIGSGAQDDDYTGQANDQVTVCRWEGCTAGDLGNMDELVERIHNEHIGIRQKKYSCEWIDCSRKGQTHASGYALRAHMRSHTREKPFYCALPGESRLMPLDAIVNGFSRTNCD